jgi:molybdopterin-guanine dinucleotide biosynthesis protein A
VREPIGVLLAGGRGSRLGGAKALVPLGGKPLICHALEALRRAVGEVAIVAKPDTALPALEDVTVWREPLEPRHPLVGIVHALSCADGRPVLVCAADMPFVTPEVLSALVAADPAGAPAVVATSADRGLQPMLGCYQAAAGALLAAAASEGTVAVRTAVAALEPRELVVIDERVLFNVNSAEDLAAAEALLMGPVPSDGSDDPRPDPEKPD